MDYDLEEIVQESGPPRSLFTAVRLIMAIPADQRHPALVLHRDEGKTPPDFELSDVESIAETPDFKAALKAALKADHRPPNSPSKHAEMRVFSHERYGKRRSISRFQRPLRSFWHADHDELRAVFIMQLPLRLGDSVLSVVALFL
jgi:hypothetical protein